ncbi:MAG: fibronectin type III domain-containing protein [Prevotellaceae bacterium]|jgi:hypothetical protein|nr:fibronectin type III domain-containing protein [Prevotellaceae bacterium]
MIKNTEKLFKSLMTLLFVVITAQSASAQIMVFEDDFESGNLLQWRQSSTGSPVVWDVGTTGVWAVTAVDGSHYAYLYTATNQTPVQLITPAVNLTASREYAITFLMAAPKFSNGDRDTLRVYSRVAGGIWTLLETIQPTTQSWQEQRINLMPYAQPETVEFAFEYNYGAGKGIALDRVAIGTQPLCTRPDALHAQRISHHSAILSWSASIYSTSYRLKVSTTPLTDFTQTADGFDGMVFNTVYTVTELSPSTTYYWYVQADCGESDVSAWSQEETFTTGCLPSTVPYSESFNSVGTGELPACWKTLVQTAGNWGTTSPAAEYTPHCRELNADMALYLSACYDNTSSEVLPRLTKAFAISPALSVNDRQEYQLSFKLYSAGRATLHIGVQSDPQDVTTFTELIGIATAGGVMEECILPMTAATDNNYIVFMADASDYNETVNIYIDDMEIAPPVSCQRPSILQTVAVTDTAASLTWTGTASSYRVRISTVPINPATAPVADILDRTVTAIPLRVESLSSRTTYYWYVQANCGGGTSEWSHQATINTAITPATLPYICSFEDETEHRQWLLKNGTQANKWVFGTAVGSNGSNGLYISNNTAGATNHYNVDATSYVYAVRTLSLDAAGEYTFQFDWMGNGEGDYDLMRVFLTPATVEPVAGNAYDMTVDKNPTPDNWIDVGGGILNSSALWNTRSAEYNVPAAGLYNLVFFWKNDGLSGVQPPAAVDNILVEKLLCRAVDSIKVENITRSSAEISWLDREVGASLWDIKIATTVLSDPSTENGIVNVQTSVKPFAVSGLTGNTLYHVYIRTSCGQNVKSVWRHAVFTTQVVCPQPTLTGHTSESTSITVAWTNGGEETAWQLVYDVSGFDPNGKTPVDITASQSYQLTNLLPDTLYDIYLRANCGIVDGVSEWTLLSCRTLPLACTTPRNITVTSLTHNSGRVKWMSENADTYNVKLSIVPINPEESAGDVDNLSTSDNYLDLTSLQSSVSYHVYIRAECGDVGTSAWAAASFITGCQPVSIPVVEQFNTYGENVSPTCWRYLTVKTGNIPEEEIMPPHIVNSSDTPTVKVLSLYGYYGDDYTSTKLLAIMPNLTTGVNGLSLRFDGYANLTGVPLVVGVMTDQADASTFEPVATLTLGIKASYAVSFHSYTDTGRYIAFMVDGDAAQKSYTACLGNVHLGVINDCQSPADVSVADITHEGATIAWQPLSVNDHKFRIQVSTVNVGNNTANADTISTFAVDTIVDIVNGVFKYTVHGLAERTNYYVYVQTVCQDNSYGERYTRLTGFRTTCASQVSLPFAEHFNGNGGIGLQPECWTVGSATGSKPPYCNTTYRYGAAGASLCFTSAAGTDAFTILPEITDLLTTAQLSFMAYKPSLHDSITVGILTDPTDITTFDSLTTVSPTATGTWQELVVSLSGYGGTGQYLAFRSQRQADNTFFIDNVLVERIPACIRPASLTVNAITDASVEIAFPETARHLKVGAYGFNPATGGRLITNVTSPYLLTELALSSCYDIYVQADCGADGTSTWRGPVTVYTNQVIETPPVISGFETDADMWRTSSNGGGNSFAVGSATCNGGASALYVSDDGGVSNSYSFPTNKATYTYAYRTVSLQAGQRYTVRFDWKAGGEKDYDLLRAFLIPDTVELSSGNAYGMTFATNTTPAGWTDIGNGNLQGETSWQNYSYSFTLQTTGIYRLTFFWKNDGYGAGGTPAAIDNFHFEEERCYAPIISVTDLTETTVGLSWESDAVTWQVVADTQAHTTASLDTLPTGIYSNYGLTTSAVNLTELSQKVMHYVYVRGLCSGGGTTAWGMFTFITPQLDTVPFFADFETPTDNVKWSFSNSEGENRWTIGAAAAAGGNSGLYISNDDGVTNEYTDTSLSHAYAYRDIRLNVGTVYSIDFEWQSNGESAFDLMRVFLVPYVVNLSSGAAYGLDETNVIPEGWVEIGNSNFSAHDTWQLFSDVFQIPATGVYHLVFFWKNDGSAGAQPSAAVDNIAIQEATCMTPRNLTASAAGDSVSIDWEPGNVPLTGWRVLVSSTSIDPTTQTADVADTLVTTHPVTIGGLSLSKTYYYYVQNQCVDKSLWSAEASFMTPCDIYTIPFEETFGNTTYPPICWNKYRALTSNVFNGGSLSATTSGWSRVTTNNGITKPHTKIYLYTAGQYYWLVSPTIHVDTTAVLLFDVALTSYNSANPIKNPAGQPDDQFMVIISDDAGATWNAANATVWNNKPDGDYVFNQLPHVAERIGIDLSAYRGKDIRIAFYGESTVAGNGSNDLHIGNINVMPTENVFVSDIVCQGYDYTEDIFDIPATQLSHAGTFTFGGTKKQPSGDYQYLTLNLTVLETGISHISASICDDEPYLENGFNELQAGIYRRNLISSTGCDSTIILTLTHASHIRTSDTITINVDDLPYSYRDTVIPATVSAGEHEFIFINPASTGCDSIHTLVVTIGTGVMFPNMLTFYLLPNPVACGDEVRIEADFTAADRNGLTVEVFNNAGIRLMTLEPETYPIRLTGFNQSGMYLVRITTGRHEVYYGKLMVQ